MVFVTQSVQTDRRAGRAKRNVIISTPDSPGYEHVRHMENLAPAMEERFAAMEQIARAGILTGTCMMPILPSLCDTDENLEATVRCAANHCDQFVTASGLTLADQQREYFFGVLRDRFTDLLALYKRLYTSGSYGAVRSGGLHRVGGRIRGLCQQYGITGRMPRPIIPGDSSPSVLAPTLVRL